MRSIPFEVLKQSEEGHEVRVGQRAQEVHHAVLLGCWVWERYKGGRKKHVRSCEIKKKCPLMTNPHPTCTHRCPPWRPGTGGRWAEAPAAPWNTASVFLRWRWCPCHSASPGCLWCLRVRQTGWRHRTTKLTLHGSWLIWFISLFHLANRPRSSVSF